MSSLATIETMPEQVEVLAARGLTMKQIAKCLGIARSTLYERGKKNPDIADAVKRGRAKGLADVTNALYDSATGGNVTAQIFYLKNRAPEEWRDRRELDIPTDGPTWVINAQPMQSIEEWQKENGLLPPAIDVESVETESNR